MENKFACLYKLPWTALQNSEGESSLCVPWWLFLFPPYFHCFISWVGMLNTISIDSGTPAILAGFGTSGCLLQLLRKWTECLSWQLPIFVGPWKIILRNMTCRIRMNIQDLVRSTLNINIINYAHAWKQANKQKSYVGDLKKIKYYNPYSPNGKEP